MKQMTIERSLEVKGILAAEQVRLQCQMKYQNEDEGKRALLRLGGRHKIFSQKMVFRKGM